MAARDIMNTIGIGQQYTNEVITKVHKIGNNLGLPEPALADTLEGLEEDMIDDIGVPINFPLDLKGSDVLLITPSADFFAEPHVDGLIGYAKVFYQAGISWILSSLTSEAANFGLFIGSEKQMKNIALRIREAALDLGVKRIVFGECGHAWRVVYNYLNDLAGPFDFLDPNHPLPLETNSIAPEPSTCVDAEPYALQVLDDSMSPEFWPGCIILIDPTGRATHESYVLATADRSDSSEDEYVFRQLRQDAEGLWTLIALNDQYQTIKTDEQLSNIVGVIVQRAGKRRHHHKRYD